MSDASGGSDLSHDHRFLGESHERSERRTWGVIWLCAAMMAIEIVGGWLFGSIALIADGLHMSTHAGALLLAALAYTFARRHADDPRFSFGTGKLGDLAGFTSAIVLAMISLLIGWEAASRLVQPVPIHFGEAIPIAALGLAVNIATAWLLGGGGHGHSHGHPHGPAHDDHRGHEHAHGAESHLPEGVHPRGDEAPARATYGDNNMRAAVVHVAADAAVSVLVIVGLLLAKAFGWMWMDPLVGLVGACVIASWSYGLLRDTGAILLDMTPDRRLESRIRQRLETDGDRLLDLHLWRLGPGHLGGIISIATADRDRDARFYRQRLHDLDALSHLTVEVNRVA